MDKNTRIAIIGAGPAGMAAAVYLEKAGYYNYTVYEKEGEVGGKCCSPMGFNGKRYEMGAVLGCPTYYTIHELEEFAGVEHNGPALNRKMKDMNGKPVDPFNPKKNPLKIPKLLKMKNQIKKLGNLLETKYKGYDINGHRGVAYGKADGYSNNAENTRYELDNPNLKDLALPFSEFLKKNGVSLAADAWIGPYTAFGYGYFDEIPAAYVLKYLDFETLMDFLKLDLWTWQDGTQSIYEAVNATLKNPAVVNADITKIERTGGKVYITVNGETETFDKLIVTAPLQYFPNYADATDQEKELFSKIDYSRYDTMGVSMKPGKTPDESYYIFDNMRNDRRGHCMLYFKRWTDDDEQPIITYVLQNHKDLPDVPYETCKQNVFQDSIDMDFPIDKIHMEKAWYYFPHIFSEDYADGWYDKVEAMQGTNNTYYAGEIMSFGDMEETATYSKELIKRFF
ncbi:MAG: FAD-dependent oxidoreductase [Acutalibacteraceae bacterium]